MISQDSSLFDINCIHFNYPRGIRRYSNHVRRTSVRIRRVGITLSFNLKDLTLENPRRHAHNNNKRFLIYGIDSGAFQNQVFSVGQLGRRRHRELYSDIGKL